MPAKHDHHVLRVCIGAALRHLRRALLLLLEGKEAMPAIQPARRALDEAAGALGEQREARW